MVKKSYNMMSLFFYLSAAENRLHTTRVFPEGIDLSMQVTEERIMIDRSSYRLSQQNFSPLPVSGDIYNMTAEQSVLRELVKNGHLEKLKKKMSKENYKQQIGYIDPLGETLLMHAARNHAVFEYIYSQKPELLNVKNSLGRHALIIAAAHGSIDVVNFLISLASPERAPDQLDLEIDHQDSFLETAFAHATINGQILVMAALRDAGANISIKNDKDMTPMMLACANGHLAAVEWLYGATSIDSLLDIDSNGLTARQHAVSSNNMAVFAFIRRKIDENSARFHANRTSVREAVRNAERRHANRGTIRLSNGAPGPSIPLQLQILHEVFYNTFMPEISRRTKIYRDGHVDPASVMQNCPNDNNNYLNALQTQGNFTPEQALIMLYRTGELIEFFDEKPAWWSRFMSCLPCCSKPAQEETPSVEL